MARQKGGTLQDSMGLTIFFGVLLIITVIVLAVLGALGYLSPSSPGDTTVPSGTAKADYPGNLNITYITVPYPGTYGFTVNLDQPSYVCNSCTGQIEAKVRYANGTSESLPVKSVPISAGAGQSVQLQPTQPMPINNVVVTAYQQNAAGVKGSVSSMSAGVGPNIHS